MDDCDDLADGVVVFLIEGGIDKCNELDLGHCDIANEAWEDVIQGYLILDEEHLEVLGV